MLRGFNTSSYSRLHAFVLCSILVGAQAACFVLVLGGTR